ncbi:hypothetical protein [Vibrio pectenicida]|uniref:Uncharacterized protein n=1 Tax=Vibrio pectenicida TaxID=62763 RepID=A0A3R9FKY5_9VIBR|nr:hypothetical protein [Vibrio pectenicida]RSD30444.1 hypothetical protein EJA03_13950 [Vibrio pectenicida]
MDAHETTDINTSLRDADIVMAPERLGAMHQNRISFSRSLIRKMARQKWQLTHTQWQLDQLGFGHVVYRLTTVENTYHLVVFCDQISDTERNDRVIAEKWDVTFALIIGELDEQLMAQLRANVPLQEAGRFRNKVLVLGRANKSVRVFGHLVAKLAKGEQPLPDSLAEVGYVLRTTAVYGNGKFGIADFKLLETNTDFRYSFSAQMCAVYLLREFSLDWVNYLAKQVGGDKAVKLEKGLRRYLGIGNATGLGMAPYLVNHPCIVDQWMTAREKAISRVLSMRCDIGSQPRFCKLLDQAVKHLKQAKTINSGQAASNHQTMAELSNIIQHLTGKVIQERPWRDNLKYFNQFSVETQEVILSCLIEMYPTLVDELEEQMNAEETLTISAQSSVDDLIVLLKEKYRWAIDEDYSLPENNYWFWYRSQDKEEPRLGVRGQEYGEEKELPLDIGRQVNRLYIELRKYAANSTIAQFLLHYPQYRTIARRVWTMAQGEMGEIQVNILRQDALPIHLLRCKLAILGATKFDPRSDRWVRVTFYQGAPLFSDLELAEMNENWLFPLMPSSNPAKEPKL